MDLLDPAMPLNLRAPGWKIYARNAVRPPQYIGPGAKVENSIVSEGVDIYGTVDFSVLFPDVIVEEGAVVRDSIIMPGCVVKKGAVVDYAILAEGCVVGQSSTVGARPEDTTDKDSWGITVLAGNTTVSPSGVVATKTTIEESPPGAPITLQEEEEALV